MGLMFLASWTWSRNYDASLGASNFFITATASPKNVYDLSSEYGLSITDSPHRVVLQTGYPLAMVQNNNVTYRPIGQPLELSGVQRRRSIHVRQHLANDS